MHELVLTLILAAILTSLVCWLFLGSWSSTFNVLLAIPTSVLGSFIILYFAGFTLNIFTLMGLSLAIGIVVDDAIMVLENIIRHLEMGKKRREAALIGAREITFAAMAASVSLVAIFLPIAFMEGFDRSLLIPVRCDDECGGDDFTFRGPNSDSDACFAIC